MKPKGTGAKWNSFVAPDTTNNTSWVAVELINKALLAAGLNVTRVSIIQAATSLGAEEIGSHEFLADKTFPKETGLNYFGDFQESAYQQFNYGDTLQWLRGLVVNSDVKNLGGAVIPWMVQMFNQIYGSGNQVAAPTNTPTYSVVSPYAAILEANPDAQAVIVKRVQPLLEAALEADGGL